jgi:hypothetical protein
MGLAHTAIGTKTTYRTFRMGISGTTLGKVV